MQICLWKKEKVCCLKYLEDPIIQFNVCTTKSADTSCHRGPRREVLGHAPGQALLL